MPELPEAETIVRVLREGATGRTIRRVRILHPDVLAGSAAAFRRGLRGRRIRHVGRRGKNVVLHLDSGRVLAVNLGMTGRLLLSERGARLNLARRLPHAAVVFDLEPGAILVYDDIRRFGRLSLLDAAGWAAHSARLGPEPLDPSFTPAALAAGLAGSRAPVRSLLLDQGRLAGVGNIYANEALFRARIHPARAGSSLESGEIRRLHRAIRSVLRAAIEGRGTTIRDYRDPGGGPGGFAPRLAVYGRDGVPCPRCGAPITRTVLRGRSAFFCPVCQPPDPTASGAAHAA